MPIPAVKGYMPLCVTPRSQVCDEQGIGQWPMWQRFDSVKAIVNQYVDEPYRDFLAFPYHEVDKMKSEELFYWYTPRCETSFSQLSKSGDDYIYYKQLLEDTLSHYRSVVDRLKSEGKSEEANFLQLSLKYAGETENSIYCGNDRVVATMWGMRPRQGYQIGESVIEKELFPPAEMHTVKYDIGDYGTTGNPVQLNKSHGSCIFAEQVPQVSAAEGYEFMGWDRNPVGAVVDDDLLFTASYRKITEETNAQTDIHQEEELEENHLNEVITSDRDNETISPAKPVELLHTVRFLTPNGDVLCKFDVEHGTRLTQDHVPPLPVIEGKECSGWNINPLDKEINAETDFVAQLPEKKKPVVAGNGGCLSALLRWLLLLLGLILLFMLIWCFMLGKCNFDFCGCNCDNQPAPISDNQPVLIDDHSPRPIPQTGDVQILLSWSGINDLDIACVDPTGQTVSYSNKSVPSGGKLDIDMNAGEPYRTDPIENIHWPVGLAPKGQYTVFLTYFKRHDRNNRVTPYTVKVKHGDITDTYTGTVTYVKERINICTFIIE